MASNAIHAGEWQVNAIRHNDPFADDKNRFL
jgi:hypothetical protein